MGTVRAFERLVFEPEARRRALLAAIAGARTSVLITIFRCDDEACVAALVAARERGVRVDVLITRRARGGVAARTSLIKALDAAGVSVHQFHDAYTKYHAKFLVIDGALAIVATQNLTRRCFTQTFDALAVTSARDVVAGLTHVFASDVAGTPVDATRLGERLILAPENARARIAGLIASARATLDVVDHKVSDPDMIRRLDDARARGVSVTVSGRGNFERLAAHGKVMLADDARMIVGSVALTDTSLDRRREVALIVSEARLVTEARRYLASVRVNDRRYTSCEVAQ